MSKDMAVSCSVFYTDGSSFVSPGRFAHICLRQQSVRTAHTDITKFTANGMYHENAAVTEAIS